MAIMPHSDTVWTVVVLVCCVLPMCCAELQWLKLSSSADDLEPLPRQQCAMVYYESGDEVIVFGGRKGATLFDDTWIYSVPGGSWSPVVYDDDMKPAARFSMVAGVSDSYLYVTMGQGRDGVCYNDVWKLNLGGSFYKWEEVIPASGELPEPRYGAVGGTYCNHGDVYVSLGFSSQRQYSTYRFDTAQEVWQEVADYIYPYSPFHPNARKFHSGTMTGENRLLIDGGCLSGGGTGGPCPSADSWMLDGERKTWSRIGDCGPARMLSAMALLPAASVDGVLVSYAVMYGGIDHSNQYISYTSLADNELMVIDVSSQQWQIKSIVSSEIPSWRSGHSMVMTSSGVMMFGGVISSASLSNELWLLSGNSSDVDDTMTSSVTQCWVYSISYITIHGCLMFIGSAIFLHWGGWVARYTRRWRLAHIVIQVCGLCMCVCGFIFACLSVQSDHFQFAHGLLGLVILILCLVQPCNALIRIPLLSSKSGPDWRMKLWTYFHSTSGRVALVLSLVNISLGLFLAVAQFYLWVGWLVCVFFYILIYIVSEIYLQISLSRKRPSTPPEGEQVQMSAVTL